MRGTVEKGDGASAEWDWRPAKPSLGLLRNVRPAQATTPAGRRADTARASTSRARQQFRREWDQAEIVRRVSGWVWKNWCKELDDVQANADAISPRLLTFPAPPR